MKLTAAILLGMVCLNVGAIWIDLCFGVGPIMTPINETDYYRAVNATALAESATQSTADNILDPTGPLVWFFELNFPFVEAFWQLLANAGVDRQLLLIFKVPYRLLELFMLIELWRGIDLTG